MNIDSSYFGQLDIPNEKLVKFQEPIPGFDDINEYFIITEDTGDFEAGEEETLFCWLHAASDGDVVFAMLDVFKVKPDYRPEIDEESLVQLDYKEGDEIGLYNIVNIPEKIEEMTANLLAPVVINLSKMRGKQVVLGNEAYSLKHRIFDDVKKMSSASADKEV